MSKSMHELTEQAKKLFYFNSGAFDDDLLAAIEHGQFDKVPALIEAHRRSLPEMPNMALEAQIKFLDKQLKIERFLSDWRECLASGVTLID